MKKYIALFLSLVMLLPLNVRAEETEDLQLMHVTCYVLQGITYTGTQTRTGICASNKEHLGQIAVVYLVNEDGSVGSCIGEYICEDIGSARGLVNGTSIDLWRANMTHAKHTMKLTKGKVYVKWIDGEG